MTFFDTATYYLIMSMVGWSLVIAQIICVVWFLKKVGGRNERNSREN
mgnify:CR=1 FL=1